MTFKSLLATVAMAGLLNHIVEGDDLDGMACLIATAGGDARNIKSLWLHPGMSYRMARMLWGTGVRPELKIAVVAGLVSCARIHIEEGAEVTDANFIAACVHGHPEIVGLLIEVGGFDVFKFSNTVRFMVLMHHMSRNWTVLTPLPGSDHPGVYDVLLASGVDPMRLARLNNKVHMDYGVPR